MRERERERERERDQHIICHNLIENYFIFQIWLHTCEITCLVFVFFDFFFLLSLLLLVVYFFQRKSYMIDISSGASLSAVIKKRESSAHFQIKYRTGWPCYYVFGWLSKPGWLHLSTSTLSRKIVCYFLEAH